MKYVAWNTAAAERRGTFGGKAGNLFRLHDASLQVPPFAVIPAEELIKHFPEGNTETKDLFYVRKLIEEIVISEGTLDELFATTSAEYVAVRSSACDEDGGAFSFAGQFETELYVTRATLAAAIKKVWLSAYSERVQIYRETNGIKSQAGIAVIVQAMIKADVSGVGFGVNPISGDRNEKVISTVFGLGEGLVSGALDSDNFFVKDGVVRSELVTKTKRIVFDDKAGHGTKLENIPVEDQVGPTLKETHLHCICAILDRLKKLYLRPQDIEFAIADGKVYLLQSRPVTTLSAIADPDGEYLVWDNSNIIESYPGLTSPLTFSFIRKMYESVYVQLSEVMGIRRHEIAANMQTYSNMLGIMEGRVYYNLRSWFKLLSLLPGYSLNAEFMEKMMGVKEKFTLHNYQPRTRFRERLRVARMIWLALKNLRRLPKMRKDFVNEFNAVMNKYESIDFSKANAWELMRYYLEFEKTLVSKWKAPLVNDLFVMAFYGALQKVVVKYELDAGGQLHNDLLCGARDIVSTDPIHRCNEMAGLIRSDEKLSALFHSNDDCQIWDAIQSEKFPVLKKLIDDYIKLWGDRTVGELKLETITYRQQPELVIRVLKGYLTQQESPFKDTDLQLREQAESKVRTHLSGKPLRRIFFNYLVRKSRDLVSNRENLRFARTRGFGMVRQIFIAIGEKFYSDGLINHPRDIFWLTKEEIFDFIQGTSHTQDLRGLVELRRKEYAAYEKRLTAERIRTKGVVYSGNSFAPEPNAIRAINGKESLKGIGCCPGVVKAKVRIVDDPHSLTSLEGDILVTSSTDPGWVTLFPTASAILVERGSLLSHSAIVSREIGKPCIVGVTGIMQKLRTGDIVEMDGSTGCIVISES